MPYNFVKMTPYTVDYKDLENTLCKTDPFLTNHNLQIEFIQKWLYILKRHDNHIVEQMEDPAAIKQLFEARISEPETFQQLLNVGNNTIFLHFRISPLLDALHATPCMEYENIPITEFFEGGPILWSPPNDLRSPPLTDPVIMVPLPLNAAPQLIIDGNHRIAAHIANGSSTIPTYCLLGKNLIDGKLFSSSFDMYFYAMLLELQCANEYFDRGASDAEILSCSLLSSKDGLFHFIEQ